MCISSVPLVPDNICTVDAKSVLYGLHDPNAFLWEDKPGHPVLIGPISAEVPRCLIT